MCACTRLLWSVSKQLGHGHRTIPISEFIYPEASVGVA